MTLFFIIAEINDFRMLLGCQENGLSKEAYGGCAACGL